MSLKTAAASAAPHPDRLRCRRSAQPAALSHLRLAEPGADATPANATSFRDTPYSRAVGTSATVLP